MPLGAAARGGGGAEARVHVLLRSGRVHGGVGVGGSGGRRPRAGGVLRRGAGRRSKRTAGWSRSSSATRWWGCSACRQPTRTTRSGRCGPVCGSCEDAEGLEGLGGGPLRLRVGINTGEALVTLGVSALSGEGFLTGDAVNTAARIQSVAPVVGSAVGLATYEATAAVFEYEELEPAALKGKAEPVRVFHAAGAAGAARDRSDADARLAVRRAARSISRC